MDEKLKDSLGRIRYYLDDDDRNYPGTFDIHVVKRCLEEVYHSLKLLSERDE